MLATTGMMKHPVTGVSYLVPVGDTSCYQTHGITVRTRPASCQEFECDYWETGFTTIVDPKVHLGPERILYIRNECGRRFVERIRDDGLYEFYFYPHQSCFTPHKLPASDEIFFRRGGDWRGNPVGDKYRFQRPDDWVDHFATHTIKMKEVHDRG